MNKTHAIIPLTLIKLKYLCLFLKHILIHFQTFLLLYHNRMDFLDVMSEKYQYFIF